MIFPVYFSHGYREREIPFNEYFGILFERSSLMPSIDPPSSDVNSSKLEKHLKYTNGLIAVLSRREKSVSPFILFEINMCLKLGKPALVFIEDTLPDNIIAPNILQKRFSTKSFSREVFEHMHALEIYKKYLGVSPIPKYQVASKQKSCLLVGFEKLHIELSSEVQAILENRGYRVIIPQPKMKLPIDNLFHFDLLNLDLAIFVHNEKNSILSYFLGAINAYQVPTITLTDNPKFEFDELIPIEFQAKQISNRDFNKDIDIINQQIELFEEDFVVLEDKEKIYNYVESLASSFSFKGQYTQELRTKIVNNIIHGDSFSNIKNTKIQNRSRINDDMNEGKK